LAKNQTAYDEQGVVEEYARCYYLYPAEKQLIQSYTPKEGVILDLGCGAGRTTILLHEMGFKVTAVDYSQPMVQQMKRRFPYLDSVVADAASLPFADRSFDTVFFSFNGLDMLYPKELRLKAIQAIAQTLKVGGHFILSSHNPRGMVGNIFDRSIRSIVSRLRFLSKLSYTGYIQEGTHGGLQPYYSPIESLITEMESCGLEWLETTDHTARLGLKMCNWLDPWPYHVFRRLNK